MSVFSFVRRTAPIGRRRRSLSQHALGRLILHVLPAILATGCAFEPPKPLSARDPADAAQEAAPVSYVPVLDGYLSLRPVAPESWLEQNRRVTPPIKP